MDNLMYNLTIYNGQFIGLPKFESVGDGATLRVVTL